ncbi:MAG: UvrB/UvrC motif-containing protein [Deltaproteobacteria bacterium]
MLCQQCNQKPANVQITQTINNQKSVIYLCEACASIKQDSLIDYQFDMGNILTSIMENIYGLSQKPVKERILCCSNCGMSFEEFKNNGKFGCANCYTEFESRLIPIFRRLHGSSTHNGKVPSKKNSGKMAEKELLGLKSMLEESIKNEEFEKAAEIRDRIKLLENQHEKIGGDE